MKFCLRENITTQKVTSSLKYLGLSDKRLKKSKFKSNKLGDLKLKGY